ncbi:hypothetical protein GCM10010405_13980 [Streptomyces macrosporus]|uniref:Uncharacterized protein n=1 Tax=Streptomyces macrosporus TaxID=44032 RepID=A0ABN3JJI3_9ACTN
MPPPFPTADPVYAMSEEDVVGLVLFPGDGDITSPDVSWSYTGFNAFRRRLAQAEGFDLSGMCGFGGQRPWSDVSTTLTPLLDHPDDDGPDLTPAQCAAILPRLEEIAHQWQEGGQRSAPPTAHRRHPPVGGCPTALRGEGRRPPLRLIDQRWAPSHRRLTESRCRRRDHESYETARGKLRLDQGRGE